METGNCCKKKQHFESDAFMVKMEGVTNMQKMHIALGHHLPGVTVIEKI